MAYDEELADRLRALLDSQDPVEKKMFGGVGFMIDGNMAIAASSKGGVLVRVDPAEADDLCEQVGVERMVMRDRPMNGWLRVDATRLEEDEDLIAWINRGIAAAAAASG